MSDLHIVISYWSILITLLSVGIGITLSLEQQGPFFIHEPPDRVDFANSTGTVISCSAQGNPIPSIRWVNREGDEVTDVAGLRHVRPDGSLVFLPFRAEDFRQDVHDATYKCLASNAVGVVGSRNVQVRGVVQVHYVVDVYDEFVIKGNTAVFRCNIPSLVRDYVTVTSWIQDSSFVIRSTALTGDRYSIFSTGQLHIRRVSHADSQKKYQCQTRHRLTSETVVSTTSGRLHLTESFRNVKPRITDSRRHIRVGQGQVVEIPCASEGYPVPTYKWYKKDLGRLTPVHIGQRVMQLDGTLVIQDTVVHDSGRYICTVNNTVGVESAETDLLVTVPLTANIQPLQQVVDVGKPAIFNCTITGHPISAVEWMKDYQPLRSTRIQHVTREVVKIVSVNRNDKGMYQCFAFNDFQSVQGTAQLSLGDYSPILLEKFSEETIKPGPSISLKCVASGNPLPQVTWRLDGMAVPEGSRYRMGDYVRSDATVVSYVNITTTQAEDGGVYECTATNDVGTVTHRQKINIFGAPFIRPMLNVSVVAGETMKIQCPFGGYPIETIKWEREGLRMPYNHRQKVYINGSLIVKDVERATDEGRYTCVVRNKDGKIAQNSLYVSVLVRPFIESFQFPNPLHQGQRYSVLCTVTKGDPPVDIKWFKDGRKIKKEQGVQIIDVAKFSSTLVFESVAPEHRGNYTCVASNAGGSVSHTATMVIHVPPRWKLEPTDTNVIKGRTAVIDCQATGFPPPRMRWTKSEGFNITGDIPGEFTPISSSSHLHVFENGSLAIHNTEEADMGYYLCQASNGIGQGLSKVIKLTVHVAAHFRLKFRAETVRKGHDAKLKCEAIGDRPITISWLKDKQQFRPQSDPRYEVKEKVLSNGITSEITIHRADRRDSALFTCVASNTFGQDDTNLQLIMQEPPDTPQDVKVVEYTSRNAKISWTAPYSGNSQITEYILQYKEEKDRWHHKTANVTVPGTETSVTVRGLQPVTTYHFRVSAANSLGKSESSPYVRVNTDEEAPGGPPQKVKAYPTGSQSVKVTWKPPRKDLHFGILKGYYVGYKVLQSQDTYIYKTLDVKGDEFLEESHLTNLRRNTKYSIIVQAFNSKGTGPPSDDVVVQTLENDPPRSPPLHVAYVNNSCISISWDSDSLDGNPVTGYILRHKWEHGNWEETQLAAGTRNFALSRLRCGARYQFILTAFNSIGKGEPSDLINAKTDGTAPVPPDKTSLLTTNTSYAIIHLDSWHDGGCPISHFTLQYRPQRQKSWILLSDKVSIDQRHYKVSDLIPGTWYQLQIIAHNEAGIMEAEYTFATVPHISEIITPSTVAESEDLPFYYDLNIILPALVSFAVVLSLLILVCIIIRRRNSSESSHSGSSIYGNRKCHLQESVQMTRVEKNSMKKTESIPSNSCYYPTPYATTCLSSSSEQKTIDTFCKQSVDEPLYATVKRTPRPPRSDFHIYHYPVNVTPDLSEDGFASTSSHWKGLSAGSKSEDIPYEKTVTVSSRHSAPKRTSKQSLR